MPARFALVSPSLWAALLAGLLLPWLSACGGGGGSPTEPPAAAAPAEVLNGISVPLAPDPVANAATVAGVDSNANALRDDVERELAMAATSPAVYTHSVALAKAQQAVITSAPSTREAAMARIKAVVCALQGDDTLGTAPVDGLAVLLNTEARRAAFTAAGTLAGEMSSDELGACN